MKGIKKHLFLFITTLFAVASFASEEYPYRSGVVRHRLSFGPVKGFYKNNNQMTVNTKAKPGFCASYKAEFFFGKKVNLLAGIEYYSQGFTFQGYYKAPGYTYAFDNTYPYSHLARIQEIDLPVGLKIAFNAEVDNYFSPYFSGGFSPRYILASYNLIVNDSTETTVLDGKGNIDFENNIGLLPVIPQLSKLNGFLYGGVGGQYNFRGSAKAIFVELTYKYALSRFSYHGYHNSNNLFIKNANLGFLIGVRF